MFGRLCISAIYVLVALNIESTYAKTTESHVDYIQSVSDLPPVIEQGGSVFKDWVQRELYAPFESIKSSKGGDLLVGFVVERSGEVSSVEILCSPSRELTEIVRGAMQRMPTFQPAKSAGVEVRHSLSYVVSFIAEMGSVNVISGTDDPFATNRESTLYESHGFIFNTEQDSTYLEFNQQVNEAIFNDKSNIEDEMIVKSVEVRDFNTLQEEHAALSPEGILTSSRQPRTPKGAPYVEYLDWIFSNIESSRRSVLNKNSTADGHITLSMVHEIDGSLSSVNIIDSSDDRLSSSIVEVLESSMVLTSALKDGLAARYRSCVSFSFQRLRMLGEISFKGEVLKAIADDKPVGVECVDELPMYDGDVTDSFFSRLTERCYDIIPDELQNLSSSVGVRLTIGKGGELVEAEPYGSNNEQLVSIVQKALLQMPSMWSPARVYDSSVSVIISGEVIFSPRHRLR